MEEEKELVTAEPKEKQERKNPWVVVHERIDKIEEAMVALDEVLDDICAALAFHEKTLANDCHCGCLKRWYLAAMKWAGYKTE